MELWIRSQDKEKLMKIDFVYLEEKSIVGYCQSTFTSPILATYKTKERALEVLDEIQNILKPKMVYKNITQDENGIESINNAFKNNHYFATSNNADIHFINNTYVYEMPKE